MPLEKKQWKEKLTPKKRNTKTSCEKCGLKTAGCISPVLVGNKTGERGKRIMIVLPGPSSPQDKLGSYLAGGTVKYLVNEIKKHGDYQYFITGLTKCLSNKIPTSFQNKFCGDQFIWDQVIDFAPDLVFLIGAGPSRYFLKTVITKSSGRAFDVIVPNTGSKDQSFKMIPLTPPSVATVMPSKMQSLVMAISVSCRYLGSQQIKKKYYYVASDLDYPKLYKYYVNYISKIKICAVDIETSGLNMFDPNSHIRMIGFSGEEHTAICVLWSAVKSSKRIYKLVKHILVSPDIKIIGQNFNFDYKFLRAREGIEVRNVVFDTKIGHYMLDETRGSHDLGNMAFNYTLDGGFKDETEKEMKEGKEVPVHALKLRNLKDCDVTLQLAKVFVPKMKAEKLNFYFGFYKDVSKVLAEMEYNGARVDMRLLKNAHAEFGPKVEELDAKFKELAKDHITKDFNTKSPDQLRVLFFDKLKLEPLKLTGKKQQPSTDAESLESLAGQSEIAQVLLEYRKYQKLLSTYVNGFLDNAIDGFIHCNFNMTTTATGRTSSSSPINLQNIPRKGDDPSPYDYIKRFFISRFPNGKILNFDMSQIELRCIAMESREPHFVRAYRSGRDMHEETARTALKVKKPTKEQRSAGKTVNFAILYGAAGEKIAKVLDIKAEEADKILNNFMSELKGYVTWKFQVIKELQNFGRVRNLLGRVRRLPDIYSADTKISSKAKRQAINFKIQSLASDIFLWSLCFAFKRMKEKKMRSVMFITVHDSIIIDSPEEEIYSVLEILTEELEKVRFHFINVPLKLDASIGDNWLEQEEFGNEFG